MKLIKGIFSLIGTALWGLIIIATVSLAFQITSGNYPMILNWSLAFVDSNCMEPEIPENTLIAVNASGDYAVGDVVVFQDKQEKTITHRIVSIDGNTYFTNGNNSESSEIQIQSEQIIGEVMFLFPSVAEMMDAFNIPLEATPDDVVAE